MTEDTSVRSWLAPLAPLAVLIALFGCAEALTRAAILVRYGDANRALQDSLDYAPYLISLSAPVPLPAPKSPGVFRVLVLGSSTARGIPADAFARALRDVVPGRVELLNYAQSGHCTQQELVMLALHGIQARPDLVLTLDGINDVVVMTKSGKAGVPYENGLVERATNDPGRYFLERLFSRSQLVNSLRKLLERTAEISIQSDRLATDSVVSLYRSNVEKMALISQSIGARYVGVLQPYLHLRRNPPAGERSMAANYEYRREFMITMMRRLGTAASEVRLPASARFVDATVACDTRSESCFLDEAHLTPAGQTALLRMVAASLAGPIAAPAREQAAFR